MWLWDQDEGRLFLLGLEVVEGGADLTRSLASYLRGGRSSRWRRSEPSTSPVKARSVEPSIVIRFELIDPAEVVELLVTDRRGGLLRDTLHQVAVTTDRVDAS